MRGFPGYFTSTPLSRWETLKAFLKNPNSVTKDVRGKGPTFTIFCKRLHDCSEPKRYRLNGGTSLYYTTPCFQVSNDDLHFIYK
jgi:hypothetical protein